MKFRSNYHNRFYWLIWSFSCKKNVLILTLIHYIHSIKTESKNLSCKLSFKRKNPWYNQFYKQFKTWRCIFSSNDALKYIKYNVGCSCKKRMNFKWSKHHDADINLKLTSISNKPNDELMKTKNSVRLLLIFFWYKVNISLSYTADTK